MEGGISGRRWTAATGLLVEFLEVNGGIPRGRRVEFLVVNGGIPGGGRRKGGISSRGVEFRIGGRRRLMLLGSWVLIELLEVDSGIPDWWKAEASATR